MPKSSVALCSPKPTMSSTRKAERTVGCGLTDGLALREVVQADPDSDQQGQLPRRANRNCVKLGWDGGVVGLPLALRPAGMGRVRPANWASCA